MPISIEDLKQHIHQSGFKADDRLRAQSLEIIWNGLLLFRANKKRKYMSHKGKFPDGHFKFPHLWPVKFPQAGRLDYQLFGLAA